MRASDQIIRVLQEAFDTEQQEGKDTRKRRLRSKRRKPAQQVKKEEGKVEITGFPVFGPLKWDDLGLGMIRHMGFVPGRAVRIEITPEKWTIAGARANSSVLLFILAGAGGLLYFLKDLLGMIGNDWGTFGSIALVVFPTLLNLAVRVQKLEFLAYEVEFLGYDAESRLLILSTLTQPGGVVALRLDLPSNERAAKIEEAKILGDLRRAHNGFIRIDGLAKIETSRIKQWSLWTLVWLIVYWLYYAYGRT